MGITRLRQVELSVDDLEGAIAFNQTAFGLEQIGKEGETVYLGVDGEALLGLTPGGTGLRCFVVGVESSDDLDELEARLGSHGVSSERRTDSGPDKAGAVRFKIISGHVIEYAVTDSAAKELSGSVGARGLDHITLRAPNPKEVAEYLRTVLRWNITDAASKPGVPGGWAGAWTRWGGQHHDVAVIGSGPDRPGDTLDHVAWTITDCNGMARAADALSELELPLESGIGRHRLGGNLFAYTWAPGGNRYEFSAEMDQVDNTEPRVWDVFPYAYSAWGQVPAETFPKGS